MRARIPPSLLEIMQGHIPLNTAYIHVNFETTAQFIALPNMKILASRKKGNALRRHYECIGTNKTVFLVQWYMLQKFMAYEKHVYQPYSCFLWIAKLTVTRYRCCESPVKTLVLENTLPFVYNASVLQGLQGTRLPQM